MKPRVFVSSTFYDLKYVREDLANFIRSHDFEPVMFEEGDIGYEAGKPLDSSCYEAMRSADMAILIIGGQHGTDASNQAKDNISEFISITHKEFSTAVSTGIPVFAFVDAKVNTEYQIYKENIDRFKDNPDYIEFRATKDIRVFDFIRSIYGLGDIPLNEFNRISDIKDFLAKQWSDMLKKYLSQCRENKEIETIKSSISKLENLVNSMLIMLDAVGKNVLKEESSEYIDIKIKQKAIEVCENMTKVFDMRDDNPIGNEQRSNDLINMFLEVKERIDSVKENFGSNWDESSRIIQNEIADQCFFTAEKYHFTIGVCFKYIDLIDEIYDDLMDENLRKETLKILTEEYYNKITKTAF